MGKVKECILNALQKGDSRVLLTTVTKIGKSGKSSKVILPWFLVGKIGRKIYVDDGDDLVIIVLVSKKQIKGDPLMLIRRKRRQPRLEVVFDPEKGDEYYKLVREKDIMEEVNDE